MRRPPTPRCLLFLTLAFAAVAVVCCSRRHGRIEGELKKWHRVTLTFTGPNSGEAATPNPFTDYRLNVTFTNRDWSVTVPGYYAADGFAAETSAEDGNKWRVHFMPVRAGKWRYRASFRFGPDVAISLDEEAGRPTAFDGAHGSFVVEESDKASPDLRGRGLLRYMGHRYLQYCQTGEYYLKGGADSPENFLAYFEFDAVRACKADTVRAGENPKVLPDGLHHYEPHAGDWREGDPTWQDGKGRNIIGALNYLASKGMNSVYFLTMNVGGDGNDVWPWTSPEERYRFDCSRLDQWEIVFSHMDALGLTLHVVTQETENDQLLDGGELGRQRKLYYRELIARFSHHPALIWNLGEENSNTDEQRKEFARYIRALDPYDHPIVVHTFPGRYDSVYRPLLGFSCFEGTSLQMSHMSGSHGETKKWVEASAAAGRKWVVCVDEIGPASTGVKPDAVDYWHDEVRRQVLWGNLMAGGSGCEWYFGYKYTDNDLSCEDWRSRDHMWDLTRYALEFFRGHLPFWEMVPADELLLGSNGYCLAKPGQVYAVYLLEGGPADLKVEQGAYSVRWGNPRTGAYPLQGSIQRIDGPGIHSIGRPPEHPDEDWVALIEKVEE